jgi:poly-beta-1,6-N-acetyl-D-glucosamine synthase
LSLVLVIPAHNEENGISQTLMSVTSQTVRPDRIIVICDNCTDGTAELAREAQGVEVWETVDNNNKKGGALNQAWDRLYQHLKPEDYLATMDADTQLDQHFFEYALETYKLKPGVGGVCATFETEPQETPLGLAQQIEYARFCRAVGRKKGMAKCLAGAAVVYSVRVLNQVYAKRGFLYSPVLVEDYELTLAIRHEGYKVVAPKRCRAMTEIMPTMRTLWHQRRRWYEGTIQELRNYGWTKYTHRDIGAQIFTLATLSLRILFVVTLLLTFFLVGTLTLPFWALLPLVIFSTVRAVEAWRLGWQYSVLAAFMFEELYLIYLEIIFVVSLFHAYLGRNEVAWVHITHEPQKEAVLETQNSA